VILDGLPHLQSGVYDGFEDGLVVFVRNPVLQYFQHFRGYLLRHLTVLIFEKGLDLRVKTKGVLDLLLLSLTVLPADVEEMGGGVAKLAGFCFVFHWMGASIIK
jgi:hypothetical protein